MLLRVLEAHGQTLAQYKWRARCKAAWEGPGGTDSDSGRSAGVGGGRAAAPRRRHGGRAVAGKSDQLNCGAWVELWKLGASNTEAGVV